MPLPSPIRLALLASTLVAVTAPAALAVKFRFAPADGLECEQRLTNHKTTSLKNVPDAPTRHETLTTVSHTKYEKRDSGYRMTVTSKSGRMERDGKVIEDPMTKLLIGRELVIDVDGDGTVKELRGYDELVKELLATLPAEAQKALANTLTPENLRTSEIAEWNGRVADFVGKKAEQGDVWEGEGEQPTPAGPIRYKVLTRFSKIEDRGGRPMVTLHFSYAADGAAAKKLLDQVMTDLKPLTNLDAETSQPTIRGGGLRVIDASTMTIESERVTRAIESPIDVQGLGKATMVRSEIRDYEFTCNK